MSGIDFNIPTAGCRCDECVIVALIVFRRERGKAGRITGVAASEPWGAIHHAHRIGAAGKQDMRPGTLCTPAINHRDKFNYPAVCDKTPGEENPPRLR
ncbi:hypothetical protein Trydic_g5439 [Trypoxylus dichotomus]